MRGSFSVVTSAARSALSLWSSTTTASQASRLCAMQLASAAFSSIGRFLAGIKKLTFGGVVI